MHDHHKRCKDGISTDLLWIHWEQVGEDQERTHTKEWEDPDQWQFFDRFRQSNSQLPNFSLTLRLLSGHKRGAFYSRLNKSRFRLVRFCRTVFSGFMPTRPQVYYESRI
jgi:hypothetical protein